MGFPRGVIGEPERSEGNHGFPSELFTDVCGL
jgi:hypothetical protein